MFHASQLDRPEDAAFYAERDARNTERRLGAEARLAAFESKHGKLPEGGRR
jgi:hypothetical protein